MNSPKWTVHWPQRRPTATIYQLTARLHKGHAAWLADLGADSPLVDELERAVCGGDWAAAHALSECLAIEIAVSD